MKWLMRKCTRCSRYTLKECCPVCGAPTRIPHPPKFSPEDKYARYRVEGAVQPQNSPAAPATSPSAKPTH